MRQIGRYADAWSKIVLVRVIDLCAAVDKVRQLGYGVGQRLCKGAFDLIVLLGWCGVVLVPKPERQRYAGTNMPLVLYKKVELVISQINRRVSARQHQRLEKSAGSANGRQVCR